MKTLVVDGDTEVDRGPWLLGAFIRSILMDEKSDCIYAFISLRGDGAGE